ncbi:MAG: type II toxin-antitoxin system Phd/YefM family antitoxin [Candidatus Nanoarchaeia archaeon]|nr:type II toxin-antitoxin system Phd/YefM family antitoxin [Candidatus Nanoarchaeia archaeon]
MDKLNVTEARKKIFKLINDTLDSHKPFGIISKKGNVVVIPEEDWNSIEETLYLSSIPGMKESILDDDGKYFGEEELAWNKDTK